jgi:hypothetical protein
VHADYLVPSDAHKLYPDINCGRVWGVNEWAHKLAHADPMNRDRARRETHLLFYAPHEICTLVMLIIHGYLCFRASLVTRTSGGEVDG